MALCKNCFHREVCEHLATWTTISLDDIPPEIPCSHFKDTADVAPRAEWIGVEERLPESGEHCLVSCTVKRCDGTLGQYICVGYYAEKFKHLAYGVDDDCVSEYNEENDEYYIAEGWYEVIKNWDDYGFVAIDDTVTHWVPLPEPPDMKGGAE